ncbi:DNA primase [Paracoccus zhejiangensis]|uniref:DNA primase n=1 Tax=Paracoccus zhejiangensis TaxID=1077935 RepID=A0A2H5EW31_9RHOB|nr:DNA primase [Paracoccus zhejiangensis]AUH63511.1 DNA primase [Paracoccus zhejiangensis]
MSLPPGFLDELRNRVPISRVIGRRVVWDQRKSNQARGDWWAPCPFHQEKSASFHCDDQKGFYYCFGCQAKGDALTFLRELDGLDFMDAVKVLANEAGLAVPEADPRARERTDHRSKLFEVTEAANRWYRMQLQTAQAAEARDYLARRGLDAAAIERFEIGFAPDQRTALTAHLREKGIPEALIVESGMSIQPEGGRPPYDRFRGRIMFPIRDLRDKLVGFGGRALAADAQAKYLNSTQNPLFDKGRNLYNGGPARSAVAKGAPLLVAEGYMDVIALERAGFQGAVAPLGTAITEDQLQMLWRITPEPVIMLDGDKAGQAAAMRLIDLALPMTGPGQALRFAVLPPGQDPDDLIRAQGPGAMTEVLAQARPLVDLLWQRETEGKVFDSPERRAALDQALRQAIARIADESTRAHYAAVIRDKRSELFGAARAAKGDRAGQGGRKGGGWQGDRKGRSGSEPALAQTRASVFVSRDAGEAILEGEILLRCGMAPTLVERIEARLERMMPADPDRAALLHDLLAGSRSEAGARALDSLRADAHLGLIPAMVDPEDLEKSEAILNHTLDRLDARRAARTELVRAEAEITGEADEGLTWRVTQITRARQRAEHPEMEDSSDLGEDRDELSAQLNAFVAAEIWRKGRK